MEESQSAKIPKQSESWSCRKCDRSKLLTLLAIRDSIAFMDGAIGRLAIDYQYGEDSSEVIPAGTPDYLQEPTAGDRYTNTIQILGWVPGWWYGNREAHRQKKRNQRRSLPLCGGSRKRGALEKSITASGSLFQNIQAEERGFQGEGMRTQHSAIQNQGSTVPGTDDPNNARINVKWSDTRWISSPSDESMPQITLQE